MNNLKKNMLNIYLIPDASNGYYTIFLYILITVAFLASVFTIVAKNPIVSVLYLILLFSNISLYLIMIGVRFIGISYLLVYVGAISILFLFILMLINIRVSELVSDTYNYIPLAVLTFIAFFVPFSGLLPDRKLILDEHGYSLNIPVFEGHQLNYVSSNDWESNIVEFTDVATIGNVMYTTYAIWLIVASLILLLAMIGSIVITVKQKY